GEFLGKVVGHVRVFQDGQQIAIDGPAVATQEQYLGGLACRSLLTLASFQDDRPHRRDLTEPMVRVVCRHELPSFGGPAPRRPSLGWSGLPTGRTHKEVREGVAVRSCRGPATLKRARQPASPDAHPCRAAGPRAIRTGGRGSRTGPSPAPAGRNAACG